MHKTYKAVIKRLREDGFDVTIIESKNLKVFYSKGNFKAVQVLAKTPSSQSSVIAGIAGFRRQLRAAGYKTLDNFTARLMTEYEMSKIVDAAAERLKNNIDSDDYDAALDCVTVLSAVLALDDECFECDNVAERAHNEYLASKY
jgi:hypothetical protein